MVLLVAKLKPSLSAIMVYNARTVEQILCKMQLKVQKEESNTYFMILS